MTDHFHVVVDQREMVMVVGTHTVRPELEALAVVVDVGLVGLDFFDEV